MLLDLSVLRETLREAPQEETVAGSEVNPYLLNKVLRPLLAGKDLCYGDIDYSRFEADDLRELAQYCDKRDRVTAVLRELVSGISKAPPAACRVRAFC